MNQKTPDTQDNEQDPRADSGEPNQGEHSDHSEPTVTSDATPSVHSEVEFVRKGDNPLTEHYSAFKPPAGEDGLPPKNPLAEFMLTRRRIFIDTLANPLPISSTLTPEAARILKYGDGSAITNDQPTQASEDQPGQQPILLIDTQRDFLSRGEIDAGGSPPLPEFLQDKTFNVLGLPNSQRCFPRRNPSLLNEIQMLLTDGTDEPDRLRFLRETLERGSFEPQWNSLAGTSIPPHFQAVATDGAQDPTPPSRRLGRLDKNLIATAFASMGRSHGEDRCTDPPDTEGESRPDLGQMETLGYIAIASSPSTSEQTTVQMRRCFDPPIPMAHTEALRQLLDQGGIDTLVFLPNGLGAGASIEPHRHFRVTTDESPAERDSGPCFGQMEILGAISITSQSPVPNQTTAHMGEPSDLPISADETE